MEGGHILYLGNDTQHHCLFVFGEEEMKAEGEKLKAKCNYRLNNNALVFLL